MSTRLLHIVATPRGLASNTGRISAVLLEGLHDRYDDLDVSTLDLFSADLPAVAGVNIKTKYALMTGQPLDEGARASWSEIERTIEQFLAADVYLLTVPMWNFGIPYALKYYIDAIVQPGYLFRYDETGRPHGLVHGKRMVCVTSRGADYTQQPLLSLDYLNTYLATIFGFVGITDIQFFSAQPMDVSPDSRRAAFRTAIGEVRSWVAGGAWEGSPPPPAEALPPEVKPQVIVEEAPDNGVA
ncbi:NAD(P)H-dependent oxidoreductase [Fodinibacter luteus]|uniref:FMN dependent NADH:quinone oxidoreductase n=1 Tax=Fodinibacter luteus TaxID=552064 RepID=A0ABP8K0K8_9MICO